MNKEVKIEIKARLEELSAVEASIEQLLETGELSDAVFGNLMVATTEAVLNAIHHGSKDDQSKVVSVILNITKNEIEVVVEDTGSGFDFDNLPDPTDPAFIEEGSGRGVFIMKNLADDVSFENNGSKVVMKFEQEMNIASGA